MKLFIILCLTSLVSCASNTNSIKRIGNMTQVCDNTGSCEIISVRGKN